MKDASDNYDRTPIQRVDSILRRIEAAICATCWSLCVRAFRA
jgi:hypothetical protein